MRITLALAFAALVLNNCAPTSPGGGSREGRAFRIDPAPPAPKDVKIIGGAPADPAAWPATWVLNGVCTATMVGSQVVLTAAHCVPNNATGTLNSRTGPIIVTCNHHDGYARNKSLDIALCQTAAPIPGGVKFERLNTDASRVALGASVTLLGYGCLVPDGSMQSMLYIGTSKIDQVPGTAPLYRLTGGAQGCKGDSGGGGYVMQGSARHIAGIMHRGDQDTVTYQVSVTAPEVRRFITSWSALPGVRAICGITPTATNCR